MLDGLIEEVVIGFLRGIGYIFADIFFQFLCYFIGWPFCKILTLGAYPKKPNYDSYHYRDSKQDTWCSFVGLLVIIGVVVAYFFWFKDGLG